MDIFSKCFTYSYANELRAQGLYPYFHALETRQGPEVVMEGKRRIMLGSNNYLGLTSCPEVMEAGRRALEQYGTGCSGSRFLNGTLKLHLELEAELAGFLRKEACCTFSTGFQSNLGILSALVGHGDYVLCDKENHASIYDGCRLSYGRMLTYGHSNMEELEIQLAKVPESAGCLIVTDGVFSMGGDVAKLPEIVALARKYGARVMVDDAHGLGVIGEGGRGTASLFGLEDEVDVIMGTFSKSLASLGGYAVGNETVIDYIRHNSALHLLRLHSPGQRRGGAGGAALHPQPSGDCGQAFRVGGLHAAGTEGARRAYHRIEYAHHSHLHIHRGKYANEGKARL